MTNQQSSTYNKATENTGQIRPQVPPPPDGASGVLREVIHSVNSDLMLMFADNMIKGLKVKGFLPA